MNTNKQLIDFFRNIADSIENSELNQAEMITAGEMFMTFLFRKNICSNERHNLSEQDLKKYVFAGWYFYNYVKINENNNLGGRRFLWLANMLTSF